MIASIPATEMKTAKTPKSYGVKSRVNKGEAAIIMSCERAVPEATVVTLRKKDPREKRFKIPSNKNDSQFFLFKRLRKNELYVMPMI